MSNDISIRGYVTVVLVMNMRRFVEPADHKRFETLRGSKEWLDVLRNDWPKKIEQHATFRVARHPMDSNSTAFRMSTDEVAFLSGIFRSSVLEDYSVPIYYLHDKDKVDFPEHVRDNLQFKNVFIEVWKHWDIYVRATATGMFVINLRRIYDRTTPLLKIASHVVSLQAAFDIPSANRRLDELSAISKLGMGNGAIQEKRKSIEAFLDWLDVEQQSQWKAQYAPVQWKLAMEVCRKLVLDAGLDITIGSDTVHLRVPDRTTNTPLHESFIIYHINELIAVEPIVHKARAGEHDEQGTNGVSVMLTQSSLEEAASQSNQTIQRKVPKILVTPHDILHSDELKQHIVALLEGAVLRKSSIATRANAGRAVTASKSQGQSKGYFPEHRHQHIHETFNYNMATWSDELCILTSRAAFIMPGRHAQHDELLLSNFSASTGEVRYTWYWEAMERMFEFVVEARVLIQLIERTSSELLSEFEMELTRVRSGMSQRNISVDYVALADKVERVANQSRLLGLGRALTAPSVWGRAAFAVEKARLLLERQDVPVLIQHAEKNVANLNELVNHIDDLYLADLSERNNRLSFYLSMLLAGLSLSVVVFAVISFWADTKQLDQQLIPSIRGFVPSIFRAGNMLALVLSSIAMIIIIVGIISFSRDVLRSLRNRRVRRRHNTHRAG